MKDSIQKDRSPWAWIPSLYLAEGLPYGMVVFASVIMYTNLGLATDKAVFYTSLLYIPWVIKSFWSPFVDILKTKRWWIFTMQLLIGTGFAGIAFTIPIENFYIQATLAFFWLMAFSSATHDIAADGFYMLGLDTNHQSVFVGIRSTFYRIAQTLGQGAMVMLAGYFSKRMGFSIAWVIIFSILAGLFVLLAFYHRFILPKPAEDFPSPDLKAGDIMQEFGEAFVTFFKKPQILSALFFLLTFRFAEGQIVKLVGPFMLASNAEGGLGLDTETVGFVYGIMGIIGLTLGGIVGGFAASRGGLKKWLWPMTLIMAPTALVYIILSYAQPDNLLVVISCVMVEQFCYGFGFAAYMLFMMYFASDAGAGNRHQASHYAICTGLMALSMLIPGLFAGWMQKLLGYNHFFIWVLICAIVPIIAVSLLKIDPEYGKKKSDE
jgi:PAT family beta-lactamase induction signal transducer AmpG